MAILGRRCATPLLSIYWRLTSYTLAAVFTPMFCVESGVHPEIAKLVRARHPYPRGLSFTLQVVFGRFVDDQLEMDESRLPPIMEGFDGLEWHTGYMQVQVPSEAYIETLSTYVGPRLAGLPDLDIISLEIHDSDWNLTRPWTSRANFSGHELVQVLLWRVLRLPILNVRTVHVFCSTTVRCFNRQQYDFPHVGIVRVVSVRSRLQVGYAAGEDLLLEQACTPFDCDIPTASRGTLEGMREEVVHIASVMQTLPTKLLDAKTMRRASADISEVHRRLAKVVDLKTILQPLPDNSQAPGGSNHRAVSKRMPLLVTGCECLSGKLSVRFLPAVVAYTSDQMRTWVLDMFQPTEFCPTDIVYGLAMAIARLETTGVVNGVIQGPMADEVRRFFGAAADTVRPFWLSWRKSLEWYALIQSGWPIFRSLSTVQFYLSMSIEVPGDSERQSAWEDGWTCDLPYVHQFRKHLWLAIGDDQPFDLQLANLVFAAVRSRTTTGCSLALASSLLAQAGVFQCRATVSMKLRMYVVSLLADSQEIVEAEFEKDPSTFLRALFLGPWPVLSVLARLEKEFDRLRPHARAFPASARIAWVPTQHALWSHFPPARRTVSFGDAERALKGGFWAKKFSEHVFGGDSRFDVRENYPCPDIMVFMSVLPRPSNGAVIYVQGESGDLWVPESASGLIYLGPEGPYETWKKPALKLDVPFASTSFAFRIRHSPLDLLHGVDDVGPRRGALAYLASRCVPNREEHFLAFREVFGNSAIALGTCNGTSLKKRTTTAQTSSRMADNFMDDAVDVSRGFDFAMAFENQNKPGYITEKIVTAYLAGAVPIYWGTHEVFEIFRPESMVYANNFSSPDTLAQHLASLIDAGFVDQMRKEPRLQEGALNRFFSWHAEVEGPLNDQMKETALRIIEDSDPNL